MKSQGIKFVSAGIGAGAVVAMGVFGVAFSSVSSADEPLSPKAPDATIGQTVTKSPAPTQEPLVKASPDIKGPAPLPPEEQGLPG